MTNVGAVLRNLGRMAIAPLRERGLLETIRSVRGWRVANEHERAEGFDARFGTDTERVLTAEDLASEGDDVVKLWRYAPTTVDAFARVLENIGVQPEKFAFVDLGSGKGRVLLLASHYAFQRIIGVELAPSLHRAAERNIELYRPEGQRCRAFDLHCMDARDWVPPPDLDLVVYLFQPFPADVFAAVLENLRRASVQHGREIVIAYLNPVFHDMMLASGFLHLVRRGARSDRGDFGWAVYSSRPRSAERQASEIGA